jgi:hydrogenase large subunit
LATSCASAICRRRAWDLSTIHDLELGDPQGIQEFVAHSWYDYSSGKASGLHPWSGETTLNYTGPEPPYEHLDIDHSYSWLKSPRWNGNAMEVGPLARVLLLYAKGHEQTQALVNYALTTLDAPVDRGTYAGDRDPRRRDAGLARRVDRKHQGR